MARGGQPFLAQARADVAHVARDQQLAPDVGRSHGYLDRHAGAVGAQRQRLVGRGAGRQRAVFGQIAQQAAEALAAGGRHDQLRRVAAQHLRAAEAEQAPGGRVPLDDAALVVEADDRLGRGVEHQRLAHLAGAQLLLPLARLLERPHHDRNATGGRSRPRGFGLRADERHDPLAGVPAVDEELDARAARPVHGRLAAHHLPHQRELVRVIRQRERETHLAAERQLARALEQHAAGAEIEHHRGVLVGALQHLRPVMQPRRDPSCDARGDRQQLLEAPVPQYRVERCRDHLVDTGVAQRLAAAGNVPTVEPDDGTRPSLRTQCTHERRSVCRRQVDHHEARAPAVHGLESQCHVLDVETVDIGTPEHRRLQLAG